MRGFGEPQTNLQSVSWIGELRSSFEDMGATVPTRAIRPRLTCMRFFRDLLLPHISASVTPAGERVCAVLAAE